MIKPTHKLPLARYGIERDRLVSSQISVADVDRIYRSLFVYSVGFYEMLNKCVGHTRYRYSIVSQIWKVFNILLEYSCKANYRMLLQAREVEHQDAAKELEAKFQKEANVLYDHEKRLRAELYELKRDNSRLSLHKEESDNMTGMMRSELERLGKSLEEETKIRIKFETKVNGLHALHRALEDKYNRSIREIHDLEQLGESHVKVIEKHAAELVILKAERVDFVSQIF